jgi:hypothetical protein
LISLPFTRDQFLDVFAAYNETLVSVVLLLWFHQHLRFSPGRSLRHRISWLLLLYALAYPALALIEGNDFPRSPTFGVPCPTTILTIAFLLTVDRLPIIIIVIPILWAFVGGSAAFLLDVRIDLMLLAAGVVLLTYVIGSRSKRPATIAR